MKKILIASILLAFGGAAHAASAPVALAAGPNTVTGTATGNCTLLQADVVATLSTGNIGNVNCDDTTANIGVAMTATSGKFKIVSLSSNGGAMATHTGTATRTAAELATSSAACSATACTSN